MSATTDPAATTVPAVAAALRDVLHDQGRRLRRRWLWHGIATVTALVAAAVTLFFTLDRTLLLPLPIRLLHTLAVATLLVAATWRFVRYPLSRRLGDVDLAVWFERTFPDLHQRLVSAVQLQAVPDDGLRNQSRPMIARLLEETKQTVAALPLQRLLDARPTARIAGVGGVLVALLAGGALWSPATLRAFLLRHVGIAASYPRDTNLRLELPPAGPDLQRSDGPDHTELVLPAGADLHVSVLAEGTVPKDCVLVVQGLRSDGGTSGDSRAVAMVPRPGGRFRHVFRRVSGSFVFHASGGDDETGDRTVSVRTVFPPQVTTITAAVTPPAYTGAATNEQHGGAVEALTGSEVELTVATTGAVTSATMVFLESGRRLPLTATAPQDDGGVPASWKARFAVTTPDRYQVELVAANGLRNPEPGTYPIAALQDYAPIGRWLLPDDEGLLLLPTALLCVRLDARDDFGLAAVDLAAQSGDTPGPARSLLPAPTTPPGPAPMAVAPTALLEVAELLGRPGAAKDGLVLQVALRDIKQPTAGVTELPRRIVQIVDEPQLAAAIARSFRGLREEVAQALDIQSDRRQQLTELLAETTPRADAATTLTAIEVGQGRIAGTLQRVHRGLMRAFDLHLWNRLETSQHAAAVVELYRQHPVDPAEPLAYDPAFYRDVAARRASGSLGALERYLDPILAMLTLADEADRGPATTVVRAIAEAQVARDGAERAQTLQRAVADQQRLEQALTALQERLQDWNDYQDLIQDVRALRDRQRDLQDRTETVRGRK